MKTLTTTIKTRGERTRTLRFLLTALFIAGTMVAAFAQPPHDKQEMREKMKAAKVGMITGKLGLTSEQAQKFWPVYNEYEEKQEKQHDKIKELKDREMNSDADYTKAIDDMLKYRQDEVDLEKEYKNKFLKVITPRQLVELYKAEREFKRMLLHRIEGRGAPRPDRPDGEGRRGRRPPGVRGHGHGHPTMPDDAPEPPAAPDAVPPAGDF